CSVGSPPSASATTARSWPRPSAGATSPCPAGSPDPPAARPSTSPPDGPGSATSTTPSPGSASSQRLRDRPPGPPSSAGPPAPKHPARKRVPRNPLGARSVTPQHLYGRQRPTEVTSPTQDPWKSANGGSRLRGLGGTQICSSPHWSYKADDREPASYSAGSGFKSLGAY